MLLRLLLFWSILFPGFHALIAKEASSGEKGRPVYIIPIRDEIEASIVYVVRRGMREAVDQNAQAVILDMDTPGGRMDYMEEIMNMLESFKGETFTYVNKKAYSAGAFIAVTTKHIYMAPSSVIGAAAPIMVGPGGDVEKLPGTYEKKIASASAARIRAAAQRNGHNAELFDAMVKETDGLTLDGKEIVKKGEILTLTDKEATAFYGKPRKPLLAEGVAESIDALVAKLGYDPALVKRIEPTGVERIARMITAISPLLLLIGIAGIYLEFKTPGLSLPGIVGILSLAIFFFGHYIAGLSGSEEVLLFVIGIILIGVELIILPGHIIPGFLGVVAILVSLVWAMVEKLPGAPTIPSLPAFQIPILKLAFSMVGAAIVIALIARFLPKAKGPLGGLILQTRLDSSTGYSTSSDRANLVGQRGVTLSMLRPSGTARFGDTVVDVISEGDFISPNENIVVKEVHGVQVVVQRA
jgi:membrane-bound serine protease (ClpP class)